MSAKKGLAVGDGDGDTSMFEEVVLAIRFHPKIMFQALFIGRYAADRFLKWLRSLMNMKDTQVVLFEKRRVQDSCFSSLLCFCGL